MLRFECPATDCPATKLTAPDITKSNVPLLIAVALSLAIAAAAFHVGTLFATYEKERIDIIVRLDAIEGTLKAVVEQTGTRVPVRRKSAQKSS